MGNSEDWCDDWRALINGKRLMFLCDVWSTRWCRWRSSSSSKLVPNETFHHGRGGTSDALLLMDESVAETRGERIFRARRWDRWPSWWMAADGRWQQRSRGAASFVKTQNKTTKTQIPNFEFFAGNGIRDPAQNSKLGRKLSFLESFFTVFKVF
jgi:hypothetical protein